MDVEAKSNRKFIIRTPSFDFDRKCGGIGQILFKAMKAHSKKIFQTDSKSGRTETFQSFLNRCVRTALCLKKMGVAKGDTVPIICYMDMDCIVPLFASFFIGALPCPLSRNLENLGPLLKDLNPRIVFVSEGAINIVVEQRLHPTTVVVLGESNNYKTLKYLISNVTDKELDNFEPVFTEDLSEKAMLSFSSGTSGTPKGIYVSQFGLVTRTPFVSHSKDGKPFDVSVLSQLPSKTLLVYSPLYWMTSIRCAMRAAILGWIIIITYESFDPVEAWELIARYKVNFMFNFTAYLIEMCNSGKPEHLDSSSLTLISAGGMLLPTKYIEGLETMLPGTHVSIVYGITEASTIAHWDLQKDEHVKMKKAKPKSVGVFASGKCFKVVDPDTEKILGPNQAGELRVKGEDIFVGTYNGNYAEYFDEDGWYKTGDLVYYDEDNCAFIVGRIKESFKYRGCFVYPTDIEEVLAKHPSVTGCLVFGNPHEKDGNHPTALVVLKEDSASVSEEQMINFVNERVHENCKIRGGVRFVKNIPMTGTGKKLRRMAKIIFDSQ